MRPVPSSTADDGTYNRLKALFLECGFTLDAVCRRLRIAKLHEMDPQGSRLGDFGPIDSLPAALIALFVEGKPVGRSLFGSELEGLLTSLNLAAAFGENQLSATVALYPIEDLYIASDRYNSPGEERFEGFEDIVYPCLFETTDRFLRMIPRGELKPDAVVADLCSGTAVAGLLLAKHAKQVYALDIAGRSTAFAKFNQRLNGISNFVAFTGDLYEPAGSMQFDCIVVHPPYQPVFRRQQIFNSGGVDGEEITKKCVEQSYGRLRPGGRLYCTAQITARELPVAQRVRQWISEASAGAQDFDVAEFVTKVHELELFASKAILNSGGTMNDFRLWMRDFSRLGVRRLDYGLLMVERHDQPRKPFTITRQAQAKWVRTEFESLFRWEQFRRSAGFETEIWAKRFVANPEMKLDVVHGLGDSAGKWEIRSYKLSAAAPFEAVIEGTQGIAFLVSLFAGGGRTAEEAYQDFAANLQIPRREFAEGLASLVSEGFLV